MIEFHPVANIFPMMTEEEYRALVVDIAEHGQREAIWTYKGQIVDRRDGTSEVKQVHNSRAQHGYREARSKLRAAAECYPWLTWVEARVGKHGEHEIEIINP